MKANPDYFNCHDRYFNSTKTDKYLRKEVGGEHGSRFKKKLVIGKYSASSSYVHCETSQGAH